MRDTSDARLARFATERVGLCIKAKLSDPLLFRSICSEISLFQILRVNAAVGRGSAEAPAQRCVARVNQGSSALLVRIFVEVLATFLQIVLGRAHLVIALFTVFCFQHFCFLLYGNISSLYALRNLVDLFL